MTLAVEDKVSLGVAVASLRQAAARNPAEPQIWRLLADHLDVSGDRRGAAAAYLNHVRHATHDPVLMSAAAALHDSRIPEVEARLRQHLMQAPTDVAAIRMLAEVAVRLDRAEDAERLLERCLELAPDFHAARHNYAIVLNRVNKPQESIVELERLLRDDPDNPAYRNLKAVALCHTGDYATAIGIYDELTRAFPAQAPIWLSLGHASKTAGRLDRAISAYRRCIELDPDFGEAYWSLANLKTFRFDEAHLDAMRRALARTDLKQEHRACIEFALGKALEDRAEYAESFEHYATGNTLRLAQIPYSADDTALRLRRARDTYSTDFLRQRAGSGCDAPDPIFIVGMPRAGSTLVEQILASHSAVEGTMELPEIISITRSLRRAAADKQPGAYHDTLARMNGAELRALGEQYLERTRIHRKLSRPYFIDKMPNNFAHVGLIHLVLPNAKIIDVRRHPLACGFSCFKQHFASGQNFTYGLENVGRYYRDYTELMAHFDAVLPGRIHRVIYEDLVEDTEHEVQRLLDYCGLPFEDACLRFFENDRPVRTASSEQVRQPIYKAGVDHWQHYESWLDPLKSALGPALAGYRGGMIGMPIPAQQVVRTLACAMPVPADEAREGEFRNSRSKVQLDIACAKKHTNSPGNQTMKKSTTSTLQRISRLTLTRLPLAAAIHMACFAPAFADADADAQQTPPPAQGTDTAAPQKTHELDTITVTAQKRTENVQEVPISIDVLSGDKLSEMNVQNTVQVLKLLPSVSYTTAGPGFGQIYMRGVASGGDGNHSGSLPSVGIYLDEEPITTIQGPLDLHMYDIQRVEALAGPQGTLYGASSQSGTIRYITNKPDPSAFSGSVSAEVNAVDHGGTGFVTEGYVNVPLTEWMALRVVGWSKQDAGYIDNVHSTLTYPSSGITDDNSAYVRKDFNFADTRGGRAALKIDLNDNWSITPTISGQGQATNGVWAYDPRYGDLKVAHFNPDNSEDRWTQSALTVQGKIGNFDIVYAFAHLNRDDRTDLDYSDYSYWYDVCCAYGSYIHDNNGNLINPSQFIHGTDNYGKTSHELRLSSPKDERFRYTVGLFTEQQEHKIHQEYRIRGLSDEQSINPDELWLTEQTRNDNDSAIFGEMTFDFTDQWSGTLGGRYFHTEDSLKGFFGFADWGWSSQGEASCFEPRVAFRTAPCSTVDKTTKESDSLGKANLTYKIDSDKMIYATWSEGFRPGGINRRATLPPYQSDFLTNYEFGWKTEWFDHRLRWNGAVFQENWKDFQFSILGANGLTEIKNAAQARIRGIESNVVWAATYNLTINGGIALYKSELTADYCGFTELDGTPITHCPPGTINPITGDAVDGPEAPSGTRLPVTAKVKGNLTARYNFGAWGQEAYVQGSVFFEGRRLSDLRVATNEILGDLPGYNTVDLSTGFKHDQWSFDFYINNAFDNRGALVRFAECSESICADQIYTTPTQPRTIGFRVTRDF